jgi:hypothetical protein
MGWDIYTWYECRLPKNKRYTEEAVGGSVGWLGGWLFQDTDKESAFLRSLDLRSDKKYAGSSQDVEENRKTVTEEGIDDHSYLFYLRRLHGMRNIPRSCAVWILELFLRLRVGRSRRVRHIVHSSIEICHRQVLGPFSITELPQIGIAC